MIRRHLITIKLREPTPRDGHTFTLYLEPSDAYKFIQARTTALTLASTHASTHARTHACEYAGSTPRESGCNDAITLRTPVTWRVRWLAGRRVGLIVCCWLLRTHLRSNCARRRSTLLSSARCTGPSSRPARSPISPPTVPRRRSCVSACTNSVSAYVRQSVLCTTAWCFCSWLCSVPVDASSVGW